MVDSTTHLPDHFPQARPSPEQPRRATLLATRLTLLFVGVVLPPICFAIGVT